MSNLPFVLIVANMCFEHLYKQFPVDKVVNCVRSIARKTVVMRKDILPQ